MNITYNIKLNSINNKRAIALSVSLQVVVALQLLDNEASPKRKRWRICLITMSSTIPIADLLAEGILRRVIASDDDDKPLGLSNHALLKDIDRGALRIGLHCGPEKRPLGQSINQ